MKKLLLFIFILNLCPAQNLNVALFADPSGLSESDRVIIVNSIQKIPDIDCCVILGDLSSNGTYIELQNLKSTLDNFDLPYFVIPGPADVVHSPGAGIYVKDLWGDDKFIFRKDSLQVTGLNVLKPWHRGNGHIKPEDLAWLNKELSENNKPVNQVFISYYGLNQQINNWQSVYNIQGKNGLSASVGTEIPGKFKPAFEKLPQFNIPGVKDIKRPNLYILRISGNKTSLLQVINDSTFKVISDIPVNKPELKQQSIPGNKNYDSNIIWKSNLQYTLYAGLEIYKDKIIAADFGGLVTCLDSTGKISWDYDAYGDVLCKPAAANNKVAVVTMQGDLNILNFSDGSHQQTIGFDEALTTDPVIYKYSGSSRIISKGNNPNLAILTGTSGGTLHCYDFETLQEIWKYSGTKNLLRHDPVKIGSQIIFADINCNIFSVNSDEGWLIWKWSPDKKDVILNQLISDGKNIYIHTSTGTIAKIDAQLGNTIWIESKYKSSNSIQLFDNDKKLIVKYEKDKLFLISASDGKQIRSFVTSYGNDEEPARMTVFNNEIFFSGDNSVLYKLDSEIKITKIFDAGKGNINSIVPFAKDKIVIADNDGKLFLLKLNK